jgi:hypothetical protein
VARAGDVLENPVTGERLVFLRTAAESGGEVLDGSLGIVADGRERTLCAGDVEVVPPGTRHNPSPLQLAVIFDEFASLGRPIAPPPALQKALFAPLAALGRARGYRARYPEYSRGA